MLTLAESPKLSDKATPDDKKLFAHVVDMRRSLLEAWRIGEFPLLSVLGTTKFASTSQRIFINTSDATRAKRTLFQDPGANNGTNLGVIPNGNSNVSAVTVFGGSNPDSTPALQIVTSASGLALNATQFGGVTQLPLNLQIGGATKSTIAIDGGMSFVQTASINRTLGFDTTIPAGYGMVVPESYEISTGITLELGADAVMEIT